MQLRIFATDQQVLQELFGTYTPTTGQSAQPVDDVTIKFLSSRREHGFFASQQVIDLLFEISKDVTVGLLVNFIWDLIQRNGATLYVNGKELSMENAESSQQQLSDAVKESQSRSA